jgi:RNA polymerase sigma factor (sigma-70 family)
MTDAELARLLVALDGTARAEAWPAFLQEFSPLILQVVRRHERQTDRVADCYLFVCEHLAADNAARLRRFRTDGAATFDTWLRLIVHNLWLDWRRREFGRYRPPVTIGSASRLEQDIFGLRWEQGLPADQAYGILSGRHPGLTWAAFEQADEGLARRLSARQRWLLITRRPRLDPLVRPDDEGNERDREDLAAEGPTPEDQTLFRSRRQELARALEQLDAEDRLIVRLRFEQGLTLEEVGQAAGCGDAKRTDRRIRSILARLRAQLE